MSVIIRDERQQNTLAIDDNRAARVNIYDSDGNKITSSNPLPTEIISPTNIEGLGDITIGETEVEIVVTGTPTDTFRIRAANDNTGIIYIGKTGVANDGSNDFVRLESGDEMIIKFDDAINSLFGRSDTAGQKANIGVILKI